MRPAAALLLVVAFAPARAAEVQPVERLALVAGASRGGPGRAVLRYATSDAREVARVLSQLGGVDREDLLLIEEPSAGDLRAALERLERRAADARARGRRPELFVYFSGHSDEEGLLLGETRLPYAQLREALDGVPAEVRVAILDSCASGAITRAKGGQLRPAFEIDVANRVRGHAFLTSSAADEASQESDRLRASFFTHALVTGLRGAADATGDGVVTLNEAYQFAFRETLARTEATQRGPQHATYDIALVGSGDVVMTDLRRAGAVLALPEPLAGKVFVRNASGQLVVELEKAPGSRVELAVDPGEYRVRVARGGALQETVVALAPAQRTLLIEARLEAVALETTAARGAAADGDLPGPAADPVPAPGGPGGRNVLALTIGSAFLRQERLSISGAEVRISSSTGMIFEIGYQRWFTDRVSFETSFVLRGLEGSTVYSTEEVSTGGSLVLGTTLGVRYAQPLSARRGLFLGVGVGAGAYVGLSSKSTVAPGIEGSGAAELVPGGRVKLSLDWFPSRRLLMGVSAGYTQLGQFRHLVAGRRTFSGPDVSFTVGFGWGR